MWRVRGGEADGRSFATRFEAQEAAYAHKQWRNVLAMARSHRPPLRNIVWFSKRVSDTRATVSTHYTGGMTLAPPLKKRKNSTSTTTTETQQQQHAYEYVTQGAMRVIEIFFDIPVPLPVFNDDDKAIAHYAIDAIN